MAKALLPPGSDADLSDELSLRKISSIRHQIVNTLLKEGLPDDVEDRKALFENMDKIERSALTKMRISADKDINASQAQTKMMVLEMLKSIGRSVPDASVSEATATVAPVLGSEFSAPTLVPGETSLDMDETNYDSFMQRVTKQGGGA